MGIVALVIGFRILLVFIWLLERIAVAGERIVWALADKNSSFWELLLYEQYYFNWHAWGG